MGCPKAAPENHYSRFSAPAVSFVCHRLHKGCKFICNKFNPLFITAYSPVWVAVFVAPAFTVYSIYGENHNFSCVNPFCPHICHMEVFKIKKSSVLAWYKKHRSALMAVNLTFHVFAHCRTVFIIIFNIHIPNLPICRKAAH